MLGVNEPIVVTTAEQFAAMDGGGNYKLGADITGNSAICK